MTLFSRKIRVEEGGISTPKLWHNNFRTSVFSADIIGTAINCMRYENARFQLTWTGADPATGTLSIQGSETDVEDDYANVKLTTAMLTGTLPSGVTLTAAGTLAFATGAAGGIKINIKDPFGFMRVFWDHTSDGAADTLTSIVGTR